MANIDDANNSHKSDKSEDSKTNYKTGSTAQTDTL